MNKHIKYIIIGFVIVLISGCFSSGKQAVEKLYYRFPDAIQSPVNNLDIIVKRPTALGIIGNRPMVVQTKDGALQQMYDNFWLDSPKILLFNYLVETFQSDLNNINSKKILYSEILRLEKKQNIAIIEIKFIIRDNNDVLIFNKTYFNELVASSHSISAFSKSISIMLEEMVKQLIEDVQQ